MRNLTCLTIALLSFTAFAEEPRDLFIPSRADQLLSRFDAAEILALRDDAAVVRVPADEVDSLSNVVHEELGGCGGFFDVTEDMSDGKSAQTILAERSANSKVTPFSLPVTVTRDERIAQLVDAVDLNHLKSFLTELTSFDDRSANTENGTRAADFLAKRAGEMGQGLAGFVVRKVVTGGYPKQPSVVATLPGTNPSLPHVVIGGHMDTLSYGKPGADDDGSGSTTVMEALRVVAKSGARFERTIDFMWYAAEERGLVGSSYVVKDFKNNRINVAAAIQFDMTGWVNPARLYDLYLTDDFTDAGLNRTLESIINAYLPGVSVGHAECGYACSDHASWTEGKVPAVYPFESHHDDYNRYIHTASDTMDRLSIDHMGQFAKIGVAFLGQMAGLQ